MCSERYIKVKLVLLTTGGSACGQVCACACVCVGANVWQTLGYIEGPGDVPWAPANPSEGSPLHNRPARDLVRIRPSLAWYKRKPALATVGDSGPRSQPAGVNSDWNTFLLRGQESLGGGRMVGPCWPVERFILY